MVIYHADFFVLRPGLIAFLIGLALALPQTFGPVKVGPITLSLYWTLFGMTLAVVGLQSFFLGCIVQVMYNYSPKVTSRWVKFFSYTRAMVVSAILALTGLGLGIPLVKEYIQGGLLLSATNSGAGHMAAVGLLFVIAAFMTFSSTLVLHAAALRGRRV
jgi:hypothetical protein